ncbi:hypothetical protein Leryth_019412 [Lithospermum erythrorhizon]|nr:hypothetical protein Leryth_019412 [Lithospermum erythrorhizon]
MRVSSLHHLRFVVLLVVLQSQGQESYLEMEDTYLIRNMEFPNKLPNSDYFHTGSNKQRRILFLASQGLFAEFQVYIVGFDRPGYGESDPDSRRTVKSTILDVEELY